MPNLVRTTVATAAAFAVGLALGARRTGATQSPATTASLLRTVAARALADRIPSVAAAIAFYALLSLVPALSVLISLYGLATAPADIPAQLVALDWPVPTELRKLLAEQALRLSVTSAGTLSTTLAVSFVAAAWSANAAVKGIFEGLDQMWELRETRSFVRLNLVSLGFTLAGIAAAAAMLWAFALAPALAAMLPERIGAIAATALRWPASIAAGFAAMLALYRFGPDRAPPRLPLQCPGAAFATALWAVASAGFSWYAATLGRYSATYGSLAGVVVVLTWAWISAMVVLVGAEITAEIERRAGS